MIPGVPPGPRRVAFATFCREIMSSPVFANKRVINRWILFDGKTAITDPTDSEMPCMRIRLLGGEVQRIAVQGDSLPTVDVQSSPVIVLELWTLGTDQSDAQDIGDMIEDVLWPRGQAARQAIRARFQAVGIYDYQLTQELSPRELSAFATDHIMSSGEYQLTIALSN